MTNPDSLTRRPEKKPRRSIPSIVMGWSRLARTGLVFFGALALAMVLLPVVDQLFFRVGGVRIGQSSAPSLVVMIMCMGLYFSGYVLMIGVPGNPPDDTRAQRIYIWLIVSIVVLTLIWYTALLITASNGA